MLQAAEAVEANEVAELQLTFLFFFAETNNGASLKTAGLEFLLPSFGFGVVSPFFSTVVLFENWIRFRRVVGGVLEGKNGSLDSEWGRYPSKKWHLRGSVNKYVVSRPSNRSKSQAACGPRVIEFPSAASGKIGDWPSGLLAFWRVNAPYGSLQAGLLAFWPSGGRGECALQMGHCPQKYGAEFPLFMGM